MTRVQLQATGWPTVSGTTSVAPRGPTCKGRAIDYRAVSNCLAHAVHPVVLVNDAENIPHRPVRLFTSQPSGCFIPLTSLPVESPSRSAARTVATHLVAPRPPQPHPPPVLGHDDVPREGYVRNLASVAEGPAVLGYETKVGDTPRGGGVTGGHGTVGAVQETLGLKMREGRRKLKP